MRYRSILAVAAIALAAYVLGAQERPEPKAEPSPHAVAIELVLSRNQLFDLALRFEIGL